MLTLLGLKIIKRNNHLLHDGFINIGGIAANHIVESSLPYPLVHLRMFLMPMVMVKKFPERLSNAIKTQNFTNILSTLEDSQKTHDILYAAYTSALRTTFRFPPRDPS